MASSWEAALPAGAADGSLKSGVVSLHDIQTGRRRLELPDLIHYVDAFETPFVSFTSKAVGGKTPTNDSQFFIHEKRPLNDVFFVDSTGGVWSGGSGGSGTGTGATMTLKLSETNGGAVTTDGVRADDVLYFTPGDGTTPDATHGYGSTGAIAARIVSIAGTDLTLSSITSIVANSDQPTGTDRVALLSPSYEDGATKGTALSKTTESDYNYTQIMRVPIEVTYRMANASLHGPDKLALMKRDAIRNWKRQLERNFLFGERGIDLSGTHERTFTEGFVTWMLRKNYSDNIIRDATNLSALTFDSLMDHMEVLFRYKSSATKWAFCSRDVIAHINKAAFIGGISNVSAQWQIGNRQNQYGINVMSINNPFGTLNLVECPALEGEYRAHMIVVDPMGVKYRYFNGYDVQWKDIDYADNAAKYGQEIYADLGLEMTMPENHGLISWAAL